MIAQGPKPKRQYSKDELMLLYVNIKKTCQRLGIEAAPQTLLAFYWVMRGRGIDGIKSVMGDIDPNALVLPVVQNIFQDTEVRIESIQQIIDDEVTRRKLFNVMGTFQIGSGFFNARTMNVDPMVGWEIVTPAENSWIEIQIPKPDKTVTAGAKPKIRRNKPCNNTNNPPIDGELAAGNKIDAVNENGVVSHEHVDPNSNSNVDSNANKIPEDDVNATTTARAPRLPSISFVEEQVPLPDVPPMPRAQVTSVRMTTTHSHYVPSRKTSARRAIYAGRGRNLTEFLKARSCTTFADAVAAIAALGQPFYAQTLAQVVNAAYELNDKGALVQKPTSHDARILPIFADIFSEHFTNAVNIVVALRRIANVVNEIQGPERIDKTIAGELGWQSTRLGRDEAPNGDSLLAKRGRMVAER